MHPAVTPSVILIDGKAITTSTEVARVFDKGHREVLRAIETLIAQLPAEYPPCNFAQGVYTLPETGNQQHRMFSMTRDGFTLLAMGFTGKRALQFKLAYIAAFNAMEQRLRAAPAPVDTLSHREIHDLNVAVNTLCSNWVFGRSTTMHVHNRLRNAFGVLSTSEIPAARFQEALAMVEGMKPLMSGFLTEVYDAKRDFEQKVLGEGLPWTPTLVARANKLKRLSAPPPKPEAGFQGEIAV
jgi:Rha family phage regulatory protein